ncbi:glutamate synthase subunit beta [Treponema sp.]|uniref:glutamate synthase subunit beta n=1 Tax=Treponema sp. TaxID=166 RepID=UPI00257995B1|nr:glutamate synthase subunit beta [Treponema sp.]MBE6354762.1 glutamate synthase subunit beta [Treponema sp.]
MAQATGFMDYKRKENASIVPLERITNFKEFHPKLDESERRNQAARCMNCGVPMCQSALRLKGMVTGCPLHNYIPEWNDALYNGQFDMAAWRLLKTSNFPEFTGRVCPALCEKACNCGNPVVNEGAVTIHDNELFIIEKAFQTGYMKAEPPVHRSGKKIAVIGSGPGGLAVADCLNKRGHSVTVFEREDKAGGLLMYGIPNMKLEKSIIERRVNLMKAEGIEFIFNADVGRSISAEHILKEYDAVALCCGAKKARPLTAAGIEKLEKNEAAKNNGGMIFAVDFLTAVTKCVIATGDALKKIGMEPTNGQIAQMLEKRNGITVEGKNVVIVGGGDTGNDCCGSAIRLGAKSVVQLEMMPCPPSERAADNPWPEWPKILKVDYGAEESISKFGHDPRIYETTVKEVISENGHISAIKTVQVEFVVKDGKRTLVEKAGTEKTLPCDLLLIAAGFTGCEPYTAQAFGVQTGDRGTVTATEYSTSLEKVFTAGDMHRGQSLVVWAIAEGRECAKQIDAYLNNQN